MYDHTPAPTRFGWVPISPRTQPEGLLYSLDQLRGKLALAAREADPRLCAIAVADEVAEEPGKVFVEGSRKPKLRAGAERSTGSPRPVSGGLQRGIYGRRT